jgi:hypothetical protein
MMVHSLDAATTLTAMGSSWWFIYVASGAQFHFTYFGHSCYRVGNLNMRANMLIFWYH